MLNPARRLLVALDTADAAAWAAAGDRKRIVTPSEAVALGADCLVVGRPIAEAADPVEAARRVVAEIANPILARP